MIIFVGDKPSAKNIDPSIPFVGTQSYKRLLQWIWEMDINITDVTLVNTTDFHKHIKVGQMKHTKFVALGNNAANFLNGIEIHNVFQTSMMKSTINPNPPVTTYHSKPWKLDVFNLPHPSGLNRKLNDKKYVRKILKECKAWLQQ